jgi:hypothetical protein
MSVHANMRVIASELLDAYKVGHPAPLERPCALEHTLSSGHSCCTSRTRMLPDESGVRKHYREAAQAQLASAQCTCLLAKPLPQPKSTMCDQHAERTPESTSPTARPLTQRQSRAMSAFTASRTW